MPKLQLRILTAESGKIEEHVDMVTMRCIYEDIGTKGVTGEIGILPGHLPFSGVLGKNRLRVRDSEMIRTFSVHGGVVNVRDDVVTILTEKAELLNE